MKLNLRLVAAGVLAATVLALPLQVAALPSPGALRPDVRLDDPWGRAVQLSKFRGMPTLVVYEDKGSAEENKELKAQLSELAKGDKYKRLVALVAVADVSGYDFWPVRGFVKDAIQVESHKQGTIIYCDWTGSIRRALDLKAKASNVVLYGRDNRVLFAHSGPMGPEQRAALIGHLRAEVEGAP
ncbi:MAG: hypothetical protein IPG50_34860 [Myxococcales bacterium]|nr:hypothetical protein [Myxococcales bacterium]